MKKAHRAAFERVEQVLGYPLLTRKELMASLLDVHTEYKRPGDIFEDLIDRNVHWKGEGHPGDYHEDPEFFAQYVKIEQPVDILARHFAGLFEFTFGPTTNELRYVLLADLNPRRDGLDCPAYRQDVGDAAVPVRGGILPWYVFESPAEEDRAGMIYHDIQFPEDESLAALRPVGARLVAEYPRAAQAYRQILESYGLEVPAGPDSYEDADGERLLRTHDALIPIAEALIARSKGEEAALTAEDAARCRAVADLESGLPPAIMVALLEPALSGRPEEARRVAKEIVDRGLGVALTQTWAHKVLTDEPPFGS